VQLEVLVALLGLICWLPISLRMVPGLLGLLRWTGLACRV